MKYTGRAGFLVQNAGGHWAVEIRRPAPGSGAYVEVLPTGETRDYHNRTDQPERYQAYTEQDCTDQD